MNLTLGNTKLCLDCETFYEGREIVQSVDRLYFITYQTGFLCLAVKQREWR